MRLASANVLTCTGYFKSYFNGTQINGARINEALINGVLITDV